MPRLRLRDRCALLAILRRASSALARDNWNASAVIGARRRIPSPRVGGATELERLRLMPLNPMSTTIARAVRQLASTGRMSSLAIPVLGDAADQIDTLTAQRDELLAALKVVTDLLADQRDFRLNNADQEDYAGVAMARALIDKAEGR
jgi:hypothetical protein